MGIAQRDANYITTLLGTSNADGTTPLVVYVSSTTNRLLVDAITSSSTGASSVGDGTTTVSTAGTRVQLTAQACAKVFIQAHESNTGTLVVGGSTVVAALVGRRGKALFATQGDWFYVSNMNLLYADSTVSGDKLTFYYEV